VAGRRDQVDQDDDVAALAGGVAEPAVAQPWRVSDPTTSRFTDPSAGALPRPGTWTELIWRNRKAV
jgi:hypothetical protein